ncbi:hypothetical protein M2168_006323 [Streptomyces sp. CZ24]|nr:hypothetical protein [Streptomyces sp. CZ24]MDH6193205.1 hypothetical protein [Streptomyces sp. CZ24]
MADIWWKADPHDLHRLTDRVSSVYIERSHVDREDNAVLVINRRENVRIPAAMSFFELATDRVMGRGAQRTRPPGC